MQSEDPDIKLPTLINGLSTLPPEQQLLLLLPRAIVPLLTITKFS